MNHSKLILVGCISAFVALTTSVLGIAGTIIGSVISSVLYNMLSEALEKPVADASLKRDFEWEIAYIFPLVVIAIIQLLLILALISQWGFLPHIFLHLFLVLQGVADNNLYRILGFSLIAMSIYPFILKPDIIKKSHGALIAFVGLIFLARGFVDASNMITDLYDDIFAYFDFPIALLALIILVYVIFMILSSAKASKNEIAPNKQSHVIRQYSKKEIDSNKKSQNIGQKSKIVKKVQNHESIEKINHEHRHERNSRSSHNKTEHVKTNKRSINKSVDNIHFESNDLLDDFKK